MSLSREQIEALDRMDRIATCWRAVSDLVLPDGDALQTRQRDHLAVLLDFLAEEYQAARVAFMAARAHPGEDPGRRFDGAFIPS